ncbi:hypothetical protein HanXRQr2_Chr04g0151941 [Helianthus annuus]|uniref:Uncharacterized protein n=1 Tax=Helianthus annuus TaxID=4232 RepID=A0A9K3J617_HELAN|nr:hypothetical protein HanXRQr2_Chr04g0151941 [Helianthus annuus]KAJ0930177.1 hypothetical protein HanPSC8_Chr04g0146321 [Helianthus annuus]
MIFNYLHHVPPKTLIPYSWLTKISKRVLFSCIWWRFKFFWPTFYLL